MKIFIVLSLILISSLNILPVFGNDFKDVTLHWLQVIGKGGNIKEPIFPGWAFSKKEYEYMNSFKEYKTPPKLSFSNYLKKTVSLNRFWYQAISDSTPQNDFSLTHKTLDTKTVSYKVVANVLQRRLPLMNLFVYDENFFPKGTCDPKYYCEKNSKGLNSYLDVVLERLLIMLCISKDLRFEKEVSDLLNYKMTPPASTLDMYNEPDREQHAILIPSELSRVKNIGIAYLNLFRVSRGKSPLNTGDPREWVDFEWSKYRYEK